MSIPPEGIDWQHYERSMADGLFSSDTAYAKNVLGISQGYFSKLKKAHYQSLPATPVNGDLPDITLSHSTATHRSASECDELQPIAAECDESQSIAVPESSQPIATHRNLSHSIAVPSRFIATDLNAIHSRLSVLEAFMGAMQAQQHLIAAPSQSVAIRRTGPTTWVSQGMQIAEDMLNAINLYALEHRQQKREVLDLALRSFFSVLAVAEAER